MTTSTTRRSGTPATPVLRTLALAIGCSLANAALADSGVGVDTWRANALDPAAGATADGCDPRGTSWLHAGTRRTPSGVAYACAPPTPLVQSHGEWQGHGSIRAGAIAIGGDDDNALAQRYIDWDSGLILALLDYTLEHPDDGRYASVRASRISDDDEYYQAAFGKAGSYRIQAFLRDLPNVLSHTARPIWNGVGTGSLTLPPGLTPGASSPADVAAASAATAERRLSVTREKRGLGFSTWLTPAWTAYANVTEEQRRGTRAFGGSFFFNYPFPDNGGVLETVKPIDDSTLNLAAGLRFAGTRWRFDVGYGGSFYRDRYTRYTWQTPFALRPIVAGAVSAPLTTGQFATEPDNDAHDLRLSATRKLPLDGEWSVTASAGRMHQDDTLIAPIDCEGVFGIGLGGRLEPGPDNPNLFRCADWNSPAALSRPTADLRVDTGLFDTRIVLHPVRAWTLRGGLRVDRQDYRSTYVAFNPLTGQYGYVAENGSQGSVVPGESGIWDPRAFASAITRVRSLPLDQQTTEANVGADWAVGARDTLGATLTFGRFEPTHRERRRVDDTGLKLSWTDRSLDDLTLRASLAFSHRDGDRYDADPYDFTYSIDLPGFVAPPGGVPVHTVEAMRKYDLAGRREVKAGLVATYAVRDDMSLGATLRGDRNRYAAQIGRRGYATWGATVQWDWQPATTTHVSAYVGFDRSILQMANVNEINDRGIDPLLGGNTYADIGRWWMTDGERDTSGGLTFARTFGRVRLDADWNVQVARGVVAYRYASPAALAWADTVLGDGPGAGRFPANAYRVDAFAVGATIALGARTSLRVFDRYQRASIDDWHTLGFDAGQVIDHRVYTDGGPEDYGINVVGVLLEVRL